MSGLCMSAKLDLKGTQLNFSGYVWLKILLYPFVQVLMWVFAGRQVVHSRMVISCSTKKGSVSCPRLRVQL